MVACSFNPMMRRPLIFLQHFCVPTFPGSRWTRPKVWNAKSPSFTDLPASLGLLQPLKRHRDAAAVCYRSRKEAERLLRLFRNTYRHDPHSTIGNKLESSSLPHLHLSPR